MSAMVMLLMAVEERVQRLSDSQWHEVHTKFHENLLVGSKLLECYSKHIAMMIP
jgi:hypothetical protein